MPSAQAASERREADLDQVLGLVHLHGVPGEQRAEEAERDPPEAAGAQRRAPASSRSRPRPDRRRSSRRAAPPRRPLRLAVGQQADVLRPAPHQEVERTQHEQHQQAHRPSTTARQPSRSMIDCSHGSSTMAPTPTPEKAMLMASAAPAHEPVRQELRMGGEGHEVGAGAHQHAERGVELPGIGDDGRQQQAGRHQDHAALDHDARAAGGP